MRFRQLPPDSLFSEAPVRIWNSTPLEVKPSPSIQALRNDFYLNQVRPSFVSLLWY
ncbi:hypothetical protein SAMN06265222_101661 [Neorhodopirellula lusitana]|uniref:Uncharacterized protein n=1 Tax=Neorhodopirellula lusitana TaxID=445327 RepID=A0ABY1PUA6_9BACT|nr:hypothetical protein [Neorhodopirellula lusitana]SMP41816.1 hypothetical protein SAMN06265222_101661 [Neorhodopirellula lusitana]